MLEEFLQTMLIGNEFEKVCDLISNLIGVKPIEISSDPVRVNERFSSLAEKLKFLYEKYSKHKLPPSYLQDDSNVLTLGLDSNKPLQMFGLNAELIRTVERFETLLQRKISETELSLIAMCCTEGVVEQKFSSQAINSINALYYSMENAFSNESRLASMFTSNRQINIAIGRIIKRNMQNNPIRMKEICSGGRSNKWNDIFSQLKDSDQIYLEVSDFVLPAKPDIPEDFAGKLHIASSTYSLLDAMSIIQPDLRFNVMMSTYGFDSVWMDGDVRYLKKDGKWYRELNRVKVLDSHPQKTVMVSTLQQRKPFEGMKLEDFGSLTTESAIEEVDINSVPYGDLIEEQYLEKKSIKLNFPGGMIQKIIEAYENHMATDGIFIIGDVTNHKNGIAISSESCDVSGLVARYKVEDYFLAKRILEERCGFEVEIKQLDELVVDELGNTWKENATSLEIDQINNNPTNIIMIVSGKQKKV